MFSQKKKRSKGWIFAVLIVVLFLLGLWLNSILNGTDDSSENSGGNNTSGKNAQSSNEIPIFEYNDVDDEENQKDSDNKISDDGNNKNESDQNSNDFSSNYNDNDPYNYDNESGENYETERENSNNNVNDSNSSSNYENNGYDNSKGKIWVVSRGNTVVVQTYDDNGNLVYKLDTDIDISMLPEYDRKALEQGMYLRNEDELYEMLQDFEG